MLDHYRGHQLLESALALSRGHLKPEERAAACVVELPSQMVGQAPPLSGGPRRCSEPRRGLLLGAPSRTAITITTGPTKAACRTAATARSNHRRLLNKAMKCEQAVFYVAKRQFVAAHGHVPYAGPFPAAGGGSGSPPRPTSRTAANMIFPRA